MKKNWGVSILIIFICLVVLVQPISAQAKTFTVANSKDWHSIYLATIYSGNTDSELLFFENLRDSQIKTKLMAKDDSILILESRNDPIIKNYESFLKVDGYTNYQTMYFEGYSDLQSFLFQNSNHKGIFILEPEFGMVSVAAAPYILEKGYMPFFINQDNIETAELLSKGEKSIIGGHIPLRYLDNIKGERYLGYPDESTFKVSELTYQELGDQSWGIITKIDEVDVSILKQGLPIFIFFGDKYVDDTVKLVKDSGITKYEIIGGSMADIAKNIESKSGVNLDMMLRYGRTITNLPGMEGKILDIDAVYFDYPTTNLEIKDAVYYSDLGKLAITFENTGNIDNMFFSNVEFMNRATSDPEMHHIHPGEEKTIPFTFGAPYDENNKRVSITTSYGFSIPLLSKIEQEEGIPLFRLDAVNSEHYEGPVIQFMESDYDFKQDVLKLDFKNMGGEEVQLFSEIALDTNRVISSKLATLEAGETGSTIIRTPYTSHEHFSERKFNITTYYGYVDTLNTRVDEVEIEKYTPGPSIYIILAYVILFLLLTWILFLFFVKRKKKHKKHKF
ncbi:MAG: hypothetical protein KAQ83_00950 [Nanoarchaeota archaeon]|nr:hypothetical protein [Nanoarchaeota archaeon]